MDLPTRWYGLSEGTVVTVKVIAEKGHGFVRFSEAHEAMAAMQRLNGEQGMVVKIAKATQGKGGGTMVERE